MSWASVTEMKGPLSCPWAPKRQGLLIRLLLPYLLFYGQKTLGTSRVQSSHSVRSPGKAHPTPRLQHHTGRYPQILTSPVHSPWLWIVHIYLPQEVLPTLTSASSNQVTYSPQALPLSTPHEVCHCQQLVTHSGSAPTALLTDGPPHPCSHLSHGLTFLSAPIPPATLHQCWALHHNRRAMVVP